MEQPKARSRGLWGLSLGVVLLLLTACGSESARPPASQAVAPVSAAAAEPGASAVATTVVGDQRILRMALSAFPDTLDPQDASFTNEIAVLVLNYEGLTRFDAELKTIPAAAERWQYSADAQEITFTLRKGLTYSDGTPLTARDFAQAIRRSLDPRGVVGNYQDTFFMIEGAEAILNTAVPTDEAILPRLFEQLGVATPDDRTIRFTLTQPTPYFHTLMAIWVAYPARQDLIDRGGDEWWQSAAYQLGNGPFQIAAIDSALNSIEFRANEHYWRGRPQLDVIEYHYIANLAVALQAYKNGEVDVMMPDPNDVAAIRADPQLSQEFVDYPGACTLVYEFNLTKAPFDDQHVREAFAYAIDRDALLRDSFKDTEVKTLTWIPPGYPGYDREENRFDFDVAKARAALAQSRYGGAAALPEIKFAYNSNNPANQARVEYFIQMIQKNLGVEITPDPIEGTTLTSMRKSIDTHPQLNVGGWCADFPDQQNWLNIYWHSRSNFAATIGYRNEQADALMDAAAVTIDPQRRAALYDQAQKLIIGDAAHVMRSNSKNQFLVKPYVKGLDFVTQDSELPGLYTGLMHVTIE